MAAAVITISISLLLLSSFSILLLNANSVVESLRERVEMEAFLDEGLSDGRIDTIRTLLTDVAGVENVDFISKERAAEIFREEFGEDIYKVLDFNPLPASYKIFLQPEYRTSEGAQEIHDSVTKIDGVDEVIYRKTLLELLDRRVRIVLLVALGIGAFITISSVFLVANTIRLAIYNKRKIIQTMKLIGATRGSVRVPFLIEGLFQGLMGGGIAAAIVFLVFEFLARWVSVELADFVKVDALTYGIVVGAGCILGVLGSLISIRRFIGEGVGAH